MNDIMTWLHSSNLRGWDSDIIGYIASGLVLAAFVMKSMVPLRITALMSNVAFIYYAVSVDMRPILVLHSILLPVNILRLTQALKDRQSLGLAPADRESLPQPTGRTFFIGWLSGTASSARPPVQPACHSGTDLRN